MIVSQFHSMIAVINNRGCVAAAEENGLVALLDFVLSGFEIQIKFMIYADSY